MRRALLAFSPLTACLGAAPDAVDTGEIPDRVPAIVSASVTCDADDAVWRFVVETDAWTGNGQVALSTDGDYVERHTMYSASAAADGSADHLELELDVVGDWRDANAGSSTAFNCQEPDLAGVLRVYTRDGDDVADCRAFGDAPERWAAWDASLACDVTLEDEAAEG